VEDLKVGTIIRDNGKLGIVSSIIENAVWHDDVPLSFTKRYEIRYFDGVVAVLRHKQIERLIKEGRIEVITK